MNDEIDFELDVPEVVLESIKKYGWVDYEYFERTMHKIELRIARKRNDDGTYDFMIFPKLYEFSPKLMSTWTLAASIVENEEAMFSCWHLFYDQMMRDIFDILHTVTHKMTKDSNLFHPVILPEAYDGV